MSWTLVFQDRTDGVTMFANTSISMSQITTDGKTFTNSFTSAYACFTSDNEFTLNDYNYYVFEMDDGYPNDGGATVTISDWTPNSTQLNTINNIAGMKEHRKFFRISVSNIWADTAFISFDPDITTSSSPEPEPEPTEKKWLLFPDGVPEHYHLQKAPWDSEPIDVSQLKYDSGDYLDNFFLAVNDGYKFEYDDNTMEYFRPSIKFNNTVSGSVFGDYWHTDDALGYYFSDFSLTCPDKQLTVDDLPVPIQDLPQVVVQLDMTKCSADRDIVTTINVGDSYEVEFTADEHYEFRYPPYVQWGVDTVEADIIDSQHSTLHLDNIDQNLTIHATAYEIEDNPPLPDAGLAFVNIYNPTFSQLKDAANAYFIKFGSGELVNVNQFIVALHKVFVPVQTDELYQPIKFGYYNTTINSKVVNSRIAKVSCGTIEVPEQYQNALDYSPYTTVRIWLPFLGFYELSIDELCNHTVELVYTIDLINGKALAEIIADDTVVYRFVGTAYEQEPYYTVSLANISTAYINGAYNMADFTPYLLIERPINLTPPNTDFEGNPTNEIVTIGDMKGYLRCKKVYASGMIATEAEKREIESLLMSGVLVD